MVYNNDMSEESNGYYLDVFNVVIFKDMGMGATDNQKMRKEDIENPILRTYIYMTNVRNTGKINFEYSLIGDNTKKEILHGKYMGICEKKKEYCSGESLKWN